VFAAVSHLPHLLAFALVSEIAGRDDAEQLLGFAAGGFRDFTRIASSSPEMWRDIALQNREALLEEIDRYAVTLATWRDLVARGDAKGLEEMMAAARAARDEWLRRYEAARSPE
jgi:prephenate dehydrogenase